MEDYPIFVRRVPILREELQSCHTKINERAVSWAPPESIESEAIAQIEQTAQMPFIHKYVAVMPELSLWVGGDGGQLHTHCRGDYPGRAVGVDIGCGMTAVQTNYGKGDLPEDLTPLRESIESRIPRSAGGYNGKVKWGAEEKVETVREMMRGERQGELIGKLGCQVAVADGDAGGRGTISLRWCWMRMMQCGRSCIQGRGAWGTSWRDIT